MRDLIESIVSNRNLTEASREVVRNKGSWGIDRMKVEELKPFLDQNREALQAQILRGDYIPQPIRGKEIPKSNGKKRLLGIPTVVDRMLQQAVSRIIMAQYEPYFSDHNFGFRPQRGTHDAIKKSHEHIHKGYRHIVDIDLKAFFDEVDHCLLLQLLYRKIRCKRTLQLIRRWLRVPIEIGGKLVKRRKGVPQGSPISPLLANIMLHELDTELERLKMPFVRYADDFSIYCKSKTEAKAIGNHVFLYLRDKLRLPINREKSGIRTPLSFGILGYKFVSQYKKGSKHQYQLTVQEKRWETLKEKLKEVTRKTSPMSFDERAQKLKEIQRGWVNYFAMARMYEKLKQIDGWIRNRLRYCIWHDWKKPERKRKNLIRLGVDPDMAYQWSRSRKGGWAIAQSPILNTTITLERLKQRGYESLLDHYFKVSPHYKDPSLFPSV